MTSFSSSIGTMWDLIPRINLNVRNLIIEPFLKSVDIGSKRTNIVTDLWRDINVH